MASAYSTPTQYAAPVPTKDINLINQVLAAKQQRFDVNSARIEEAVSQVSNIDLLREPEQIKLKERLNGLLNQVAQGSKLDLTDNSTAKMLQSSVSSVIDEDLLKHVGIARNTKAFEQRLKELEKDDPEAYNEANKQYAYYKAGFGEYMKGERDDIDSLKYNPYYDINENLQKDLESYAKNHGYVKDIDEDGNEIFISQKDTKTLTPDKIQSFLDLRMQQDPKLVRQMEINAYAETGGMPDDKLVEQFKKKSDKTIAEYEKEIKRLDVKLKNIGNPQSIAEAKQKKKRLRDTITSMQAVDYGGSFDVEGARFNMYKEEMIGNYVNTYAKQDVEGITRTNLSKIVGSAIGKSTGRTSDTQAGTVGVVSIQEGQEVAGEAPKKTLTTMKESIEGKAKTLHSMLEFQEEDYKAKSNEEKEAHIMELRNIINEEGFSLSAEGGMSPQVYEQVKLLDQDYKRLENIDKSLDKSFAPKIKQFYEAIRLGPKDELNLPNLSQTMPITTQMIRQGKTYLPKGVNREQLSAEDKNKYFTEAEEKFVNSEFATAYARQEGGEVAEYAEEYAANQIKGLDFKKVFGDDVGEQLNKQVSENQEMQDASWWGGIGKALMGGIGALKDEADMAVLGKFYVRPKDKSLFIKGQLTEQNSMIDMMERGNREVDLAGDRIDREWLTEDSEIEDLERDDLKGMQGYNQIFSDEFEASLLNDVKGQQESSASNFIETSALVLNPDIDTDKTYTESLDSLILDKAVQTGNFKPMDGTKYRIIPSGDPSKVTIGYEGVLKRNKKDKDGEWKDTEFTTIEIPVKDLERNSSLVGLAGMATDRVTDWAFSPKNPRKFEETVSYTVQDTDQKSLEFSTGFINRFGNKISPEQRAKLASGEVFNSKYDYLELAEQQDLTPEQIAAYQQDILNTNYSVKYTRENGTFILTLHNDEGFIKLNKETDLDRYNTRFTDNFDIHIYSLRAASLIQQYVGDQIKKYKKK